MGIEVNPSTYTHTCLDTYIYTKIHKHTNIGIHVDILSLNTHAHTHMNLMRCYTLKIFLGIWNHTHILVELGIIDHSHILTWIYKAMMDTI